MDSHGLFYKIPGLCDWRGTTLVAFCVAILWRKRIARSRTWGPGVFEPFLADLAFLQTPAGLDRLADIPQE